MILLGIVVGIIVFLAISALLARIFSANGAEQGAITALITAEARGDERAAINLVYRCNTSSSCRERMAQNVAALRHPGSITIVQLSPSTSFSIATHVGIARVAWEAGSSLPRVQCLVVRRAGNALTGLRVELLHVSLRIASDSSCPPSF